MKLTEKRHIASWTLLAVFVPLLLFSSIHIHESHDSAQTECDDCATHHCHGHIIQTELSFCDCVLCQFLSLSFVAARVAAIIFIFNVLWIFKAPLHCAVYDTCRDNHVTRGPPIV